MQRGIKAKINICYQGSNIGCFVVEVPSKVFVEVFRNFLKSIKIIDEEESSLENVVKIEIIE